MTVKTRGKIDWRLLTPVDYAFLHFKAALVIMLWSPMWQSPSIQSTLTGLMLTAWIFVTAAGFLVSIWGLVVGAQHTDRRMQGFRIEMAGLWLLMAGPLVFLAVQVGIWWTTGQNKGLAIMFPYVVGAALLARIVMVKQAMRTTLYRFPGEEAGDA